jgi:anti-sigma factor RsiW
MNCPDSDVLTRHVYGEPMAVDEKFRLHLERCEHCRREVNKIRNLDEALGKIMREGIHLSLDQANCPDSMTLAAYMDQKISESERSSIEDHLSTCDTCLDNLVAAVERSKLISENSRAVPAHVLEQAIALEQRRRPAREGLFDLVFRLRKSAVELISASGEWAVLPALAPAVRAKSGGSGQNRVQVQNKIGGYRIEIEVEQMKAGLGDVVVRVAEDRGKSVDGVRLTLMVEQRERASYVTRQGQAIFDGLQPGEYSLALSDRRGSTGTVRFEIQGER